MLAFRDRVVAPRRAELVARIEQEPERLAGPAAAAVDQLIGPVCYRSVIAGRPLDPSFLQAVVAAVIRPATAGEAQDA